MKRGLFLVLIFIVVIAPNFNSVGAASLPMWQDQTTAQPSPPPPDPRLGVVTAYLQLNEDQVRSLLVLLRTRSEAVEPLQRALHEQEGQLARLLQAPDPEPAAIGSIVITIRGTRAQIEAAEDTFRSGFMDILDNHQQRKLVGLEQFIESDRAAPAFLSLGLIEVDLRPEPLSTIGKALGLDKAR